jgi:hypothetical protein
MTQFFNLTIVMLDLVRQFSKTFSGPNSSNLESNRDAILILENN